MIEAFAKLIEQYPVLLLVMLLVLVVGIVRVGLMVVTVIIPSVDIGKRPILEAEGMVVGIDQAAGTDPKAMPVWTVYVALDGKQDTLLYSGIGDVPYALRQRVRCQYVIGRFSCRAWPYERGNGHSPNLPAAI